MKLFAILLLALSGFLYADSYEKKLLREKKESYALFLFLSHIRREISSFQKPLDEIIKCYDNPDLQISGFLEDAKANGLADAASRAEKTLSLKKEALDALSSFGERAGHGFLDAEIRLLDYYIPLFASLAEDLKNELPKKKKICRALLLSGGLSALLFVL